MPLTRTALVWTLSGVAAAAVLVTGGAVWALATSAPTGGGNAGGSSSHASAPGSVPPLYTGDELEWLLLPNEKLTSLLHATDIQAVSATYRTIGETEGVHAEPQTCNPHVFDDYVGMIGIRGTAWMQGGLVGAMAARQYPSAAQAKAWAAELTDIIPECTTFDIKQTDTLLSSQALSSPIEASNDEARAVVYLQTNSKHDKYNTDVLHAVMVHGNVVVNLFVGYNDSIDVDQKALAEALISQATAAHEQLRQQLG